MYFVLPNITNINVKQYNTITILKNIYVHINYNRFIITNIYYLGLVSSHLCRVITNTT